MEGVAKYEPPKICRNAKALYSAEMKTLQRLSSEEQECGQQEQEEGKTERNPRGRTLSKRDQPNPKRAATHQNDNARAGEIKDNGRD